MEIDRRRIAAADNHANAFANYRLIGPGQNGRQGRRSARLRNNPQYVPKRPLALYNCVIGNEYDAVHMIFDDWEDTFADSARRQRIRR